MLAGNPITAENTEVSSVTSSELAWDPELNWDFMRFGPMGRCLSLAAFGAVYFALVVLGYALRDSSESLTIIWPAAGLLFVALLSSPPRNWIWLLAIHGIVQFGLYAVYASPANWGWGLVFAMANALDAIVGAAIARRPIAAPLTARSRKVLQFIAATACGAAASAVVGAYASIHTTGGIHFFRQWQLWWAGNWLGSLFISPVVYAWVLRWRARNKTAPPPRRGNLALVSVAVLGVTFWLCASTPEALSPILHTPVLLLAMVIVAAFRLPPRWSTTLTALSVLIFAYYSSRQLGPFSIEPDSLLRIGAVQLYLATLIVINSMLAIVLLEMRGSMLLLGRSEDRYRNFVERSSEAVWQIELAQPMALSLDLDTQIAWLRRHAYIAECNLVYRRLNHELGLQDTDMRAWRADVPWSAVYLQNLDKAARHGYSIDDLQFTLSSGSMVSTYITCFSGVIEDAKLVRIWGVARNITELVELNHRLQKNQEKLQMYARQLAGAEERARRATAVDLHDGIGQQLVGLTLMLDAAASRSPPEVRLLLGEATHTLREVHAITQRVIADLSPPGLYELGLEPALQWLSIYMRGRDGLQVQLHVQVDESAFDLELRILAFKLIRELLRNVIKHSGVKAAVVKATTTAQHLHIEVMDQGVGFEWQLSLFAAHTEGFGLWSVADRVREAAGEMAVDTAPGRGCRVTVVFPLRQWRDGPRPLLRNESLHSGGDGPSDSAVNFSGP
jgi:signal transduction histidine kinase